MSDFSAPTNGTPSNKPTPEERREKWLKDYNTNRASRGKPALTPYEIGKRREWELLYRDSLDPAERQRAYEEIQRQDVAPDVAKPASAAAQREYREKIARMLGPAKDRAPVPDVVAALAAEVPVAREWTPPAFPDDGIPF